MVLVLEVIVVIIIKVILVVLLVIALVVVVAIVLLVMEVKVLVKMPCTNNNDNSNENIRGSAIRCSVVLGIRPPIRWHTLAPMLPVITVVPLIAAILTASRGRTLGIQRIPLGFLVKNEIAKTCYDNTKFLKTRRITVILI